MDEIDWQETYDAAMDSVNLLDAGQQDGESDEDWAASVDRNVEHLRIQVAKEWPAEFDLTSFYDAIEAHGA